MAESLPVPSGQVGGSDRFAGPNSMAIPMREESMYSDRMYIGTEGGGDRRKRGAVDSSSGTNKYRGKRGYIKRGIKALQC